MFQIYPISKWLTEVASQAPCRPLQHEQTLMTGERKWLTDRRDVSRTGSWDSLNKAALRSSWWNLLKSQASGWPLQEDFTHLSVVPWRIQEVSVRVMANAGVFDQSQLLEPRANTAQVCHFPSNSCRTEVVQLRITMSDAGATQDHHVWRYPQPSLPEQGDTNQSWMFQFFKNKFEKYHQGSLLLPQCQSACSRRYSQAHQLWPLATFCLDHDKVPCRKKEAS